MSETSKIMELPQGSTLSFKDSFFLGRGSITLVYEKKGEIVEKNVQALYMKVNYEHVAFSIKALTDVKLLSLKISQNAKEEQLEWRATINQGLVGVSMNGIPMEETDSNFFQKNSDQVKVSLLPKV